MGGGTPVVNTKKKQATTGKTLQSRTPLSIPKIMSVLRFCPKRTFFTFQGKYYKQVKGAAMGSPLRPVVANLFMEDFKTRALSSSPNPPRVWLRFVEDTFVIYKAEYACQFPTHINYLDPNIQFTIESPYQKGFLPFLNILASQGPNCILITTIYRRPTHTDQYLHWDSHHSIPNKYNI